MSDKGKNHVIYFNYLYNLNTLHEVLVKNRT